METTERIFCFQLKYIIAIVKPFLVEKILDGLRFAPLEALWVREVKGHSRQKNYLDQYTVSEYSHAFLSKVEINMWVDDTRSEEIIRKVVEIARTGRLGDGKLLILNADAYAWDAQPSEIELGSE